MNVGQINFDNPFNYDIKAEEKLFLEMRILRTMINRLSYNKKNTKRIIRKLEREMKKISKKYSDTVFENLLFEKREEEIEVINMYNGK